MKKFQVIIRPFILIFLSGFTYNLQAQIEDTLLSELKEEERAAINALALYPEKTRTAVLEAALHPEALIKIENIQSKTADSFKNLIDTYPKSTQEMIWDLTRYPDLIQGLVSIDPQSNGDLKVILKDYPEVIHQRAEEGYNNYYKVLVEIDALNQTVERTFESLLLQYPPKTKMALEELLALPEVLTILTENIRLTILVGDLYSKDPEGVLAKSDSLNIAAARQNAQEVEDWKNSLENNPKAMEEFKKSAESFAEEHGQKDEYYKFDGDDLYYDADTDYLPEDYYDEESEDKVVHHYYEYHYPYWFGYPWWYQYPRWRLQPYWYDWGFYFMPGQTMVIIGLPSYYFTHWYFYHPYHHYWYPYLSTQFSDHYYGHRGVGSSITTGLKTWRNQNGRIVTDDWLVNDGNLVQRFQEFGKMETARTKYNRDHPKKALTQAEYMDRYSKRYPNVNKTNPGGRTIYEEPAYQPRTKAPVYEPDLRAPNIPKRQKETIKSKKKTRFPRVNQGKEYHKNSWEQSKSSQRRIVTPPRTSRTRTLPRTKTKVPKVRKNSGRNN